MIGFPTFPIHCSDSLSLSFNVANKHLYHYILKLNNQQPEKTISLPQHKRPLLVQVKIDPLYTRFKSIWWCVVTSPENSDTAYGGDAKTNQESAVG